MDRKIILKAIMTRSHELQRLGYTKSEACKKAWKEAKDKIAEKLNQNGLNVVQRKDVKESISDELFYVEINRIEFVFSKDKAQDNNLCMFDIVEMQTYKKVSKIEKVSILTQLHYIGYGLYEVNIKNKETRTDMGNYIKIVVYSAGIPLESKECDKPKNQSKRIKTK